jgi:hypothetical protein
MRKAKIVLAAGLGLAVLASLGVSVAAMRTRRITFDNYQRIAAGMSRSEVETMLGSPGDFTTGPTSDDPGSEGVNYYCGSQLGPVHHLEWLADKTGVYVSFDSTGRVYDKQFWRQHRENQTALQTLCWLARRQWRRWFPEEVMQTGYIRPQPPQF